LICTILCHQQDAGDWEGLVDGEKAMSAVQLPIIRPVAPAWNKSRIIGQKRPLQPKHVWTIRVRREIADNIRDLALFNMAIDCKPRGCDFVRLKVRDVFVSGHMKERASFMQSKAQRPVQFEFTEQTRKTVQRWIESPATFGCDDLWPSRFHDSPHLSTRQYARILRGWVTLIGLEPSAYGTHSMRRTKAAQIYKKTGNLRAVQLLLGHTKMDSTVQYLGNELEDALEISEGVEV
jgi:site-specific recombinase XerC